MFKKHTVLITCLLSFLLLLNITSVHSAGNYSLIIDDAEDLLTDTEESMLEVSMRPITEYGNVAFVSVKQYRDTGTYAKNTYRSLFGTDSGLLFVIDMGERNIWIYCDGMIYRTINKAYAYTITDNVYTFASRGEYYLCARSVYEDALSLLQGNRIAQPMKYISNALIALVVSLLANFLLLMRQRKPEVDTSLKTLRAMTTSAGISVLSRKMTSSRKTRHVESSGGGSSGGGGGGGGSSGGGGGHSF